MRIAFWIVLLACSCNAYGQTLAVAYGPHGLERLTYGNSAVVDVERWPADEFRIGHMKAFDSAGKALTSGQYGWGENHISRVWDAGSKAWTYTFTWGSIRAQYRQQGESLTIEVTMVNRRDSGVVIDGATVYPVVLHPPGSGQAPRVRDGSLEPAVTPLTWSGGEVVAVAPDAEKPIWSGFEAAKDGALALVCSGTRPDSVGPDADHKGLQVRPGESRTYTVSLRFAKSSTPAVQIADDAYRGWAAQWPSRPAWKDRRIVGTVFLASSPQGEKTLPGGFPLNPHRYFNDAGVDVKSEAGLQRFQERILAQAAAVVTNLKRMDAQGAITWDIEGEEFPQDTSYVCAPDAIARAAPEMESVVGHGSRYAGMKLVDAYFKTLRDAGFRVGVCVRPQRFALEADGRAHQAFLPDSEVAAEIIRKVRYAHDRWGATLFYLDSTVGKSGMPLAAAVMEAAAAAVPDALLIPEESSFRMYRAMAPFTTFLFHGDVGTSGEVRAAYPEAFSVNMINDVDPNKLAAHRRELVDAVRGGDVLMVHAGYWHQNNATVMEIYREARLRRDGKRNIIP